MDKDTVQVRVSLWRSPAMRALVGVAVLGFASFSITLASLPVYAVAGGARESVAGVVTTVLLTVTIAVQALVPPLTGRFGQTRVLAAGLVALGAPAPFYAIDDGVGWICALSAIRGVGFAVLTVLGVTMVAQIVPPERRGEGIGIYGLGIAIANLLCVPGGVALALDGHIGWLAWLAATPLLGLLLVPTLARRLPAAAVRPTTPDRSSRSAALAALPPSVVVFAVTLSSGGLVTYLPIERPDGAVASMALLLFSLTGAISRWRVGPLADRFGTRLLLPAGLAIAAAGLVVVAVGLATSTPGVLVGAAVFGVGFGATQSLSLVTAFARAGGGRTTAASSIWNASFDAGTALGALVVGFVATGIGLYWTYVALAAGLTVAVPLAVASTRRASTRN